MAKRVAPAELLGKPVKRVWGIQILTYNNTVIGMTPEVDSREEAQVKKDELLDRAKKNGGGVAFNIKTRLVTEWEDG